MKIALVILHADPARGGAERYTVDLAAALRDRKQAVTLVSASAGPAIEGVESVVLSLSGATRRRQYLGFIDSVEELRRRRPFDILHAMLPVRACDVYHPHAGLAAEAVAEGHLAKASPWRRSLSKIANRFNAKRQTFAAVERALLESTRPPVVLGLSDYVNRSVHRQYPQLPSDRLLKLFNGVDLQRFDPAARPHAGADLRRRFGIADDDVVGVMLAQDFARKGLSEAIAALAATKEMRLRLLVAGRQNPSPYRRLANSLGVSDRITFAGPTDDPYAFYAAAQFYVLPTRHDPCSLGVLEALAMGTPVISTVFNGACEVMVSGQHGFVLPDPTDVHALSAAMKRLIDQNYQRQLRSACLLLRPTLSYGSHVDRLQAIYASTRSTGAVSAG